MELTSGQYYALEDHMFDLHREIVPLSRHDELDDVLDGIATKAMNRRVIKVVRKYEVEKPS